MSDGLRSPDRRTALVALRDYLAGQLEIADPGPAAALAGRMVDVLREIDALPTGDEVSPLSEISERRARRRAGQCE